ncbi:Hypothetical protein PHPALM_21137 [Phytophthora palmivora]|uniref:Uncharacterized protein n=1 Tax=Phytophthora palmivora TaxID=4796 RepID=A0A2P4XD29_9STRA|nr:Hypothetical protein PHPALM_21137 [Phytophthora palmivora]
MEAELMERIKVFATEKRIDIRTLSVDEDPVLQDAELVESVNRILKRTRKYNARVPITWAQSFKKRRGLLPDQIMKARPRGKNLHPR